MLLALSVVLCNVSAEAAAVGGKNITSAGAFVMDFETGEELFSYNADAARAPGSMTKLMSLYIVLEEIGNGGISYDTITHISKNTYNISRNRVYQSVLPLNYNEDYRVDELIDAVLVYSACGATLALAELVSGNESDFVKRMNETAQRMGIDARYFDCMGIANNQVTPRAQAALARNLINDYPEILKISSKKSISFHGRTYRTTNHLLDTYYYYGADGLKTGTTAAAGYCFCGTAVRDGNRIITVTMASSSSGQRFIDTQRLLDYGFGRVDSSRNLYQTDAEVYINSNRIPSFYTKKFGGGCVIIAEDLAGYGYDVSYNDSSKTLYLKYNPDKSFFPVDMTYYDGLKKGSAVLKAQEPNQINVVIEKNGVQYRPWRVLMLDGYTAVFVDELQSFVSSFGYRDGIVTIWN